MACTHTTKDVSLSTTDENLLGVANAVLGVAGLRGVLKELAVFEQSTKFRPLSFSVFVEQGRRIYGCFKNRHY